MAKGNFIEYVVSDNPNKYPNGGEQGGYYHEVFDGSGQYVWKKLTAPNGDFVDFVVSDDEAFYPNGAIHTDGYFYFRISTTGTVNVKFYMPEKYADLNGDYQMLAKGGYTLCGQRADANTGELINVYAYTGTVNLATMIRPAVTLPDGFQGWYNNNGNVFDAIYNLAVTQKQETAALYNTTAANNAAFVYRFDTPSYTETGVRADRIFINKLSGNSAVTLDSDNESYWLGYSWNFYAVPSGTTFNPLAPDETYKSEPYTNNVNAAAGYTYYMIYEYNEETW